MHYEIYFTLLQTCVADMTVTVTYKYGGRVFGYNSVPHSQSLFKSTLLYISFFFFNMNVIPSFEVLGTTHHANDS